MAIPTVIAAVPASGDRIDVSGPFNLGYELSNFWTTRLAKIRDDPEYVPQLPP